MKSERKSLKRKKRKINKKSKTVIPKKFKTNKRIFYCFLSSFLIFMSIIFTFIILRYKKYQKIYNKDWNIKELIQKDINLEHDACIFIKYKLKKRTQPLDYENELFFILALISCRIPFSFIRFADGEEFILRGTTLNQKLDHWYWDPKHDKFRQSLIESTSICTTPNNFIGIPCKNWEAISQSIISYSRCTSSQFMSYSMLFVNKNFENFKDWILRFIDSSNRWKIILVANSIINKNISWAYKYFPIPDHVVDNWESISSSLLRKLTDEAKQNNLIFFISGGPAADIIISYLIKINKKNIYLDLGSSIEFITKGYSTRSYLNKNSVHALKGCECFYLKNKTVIYTD